MHKSPVGFVSLEPHPHQCLPTKFWGGTQELFAVALHLTLKVVSLLHTLWIPECVTQLPRGSKVGSIDHWVFQLIYFACHHSRWDSWNSKNASPLLKSKLHLYLILSLFIYF